MQGGGAAARGRVVRRLTARSLAWLSPLPPLLPFGEREHIASLALGREEAGGRAGVGEAATVLSSLSWRRRRSKPSGTTPPVPKPVKPLFLLAFVPFSLDVWLVEIYTTMVVFFRRDCNLRCTTFFRVLGDRSEVSRMRVANLSSRRDGWCSSSMLLACSTSE